MAAHFTVTVHSAAGESINQQAHSIARLLTQVAHALQSGKPVGMVSSPGVGSASYQFGSPDKE